jgi:hypothetical protein
MEGFSTDQSVVTSFTYSVRLLLRFFPPLRRGCRCYLPGHATWAYTPGGRRRSQDLLWICSGNIGHYFDQACTNFKLLWVTVLCNGLTTQQSLSHTEMQPAMAAQKLSHSEKFDVDTNFPVLMVSGTTILGVQAHHQYLDITTSKFITSIMLI